MSYSVERLTMYALISGIERDIIRVVAENILSFSSLSDILPESDFKKICCRAERDFEIKCSEISDLSLIDFTDFGDLVSLINGHKDKLPAYLQKFIKEYHQKLCGLIPIRNRVMHSRPILIEDFPYVLDLSKDLVPKHKDVFRTLFETTEKLQENPAFVLNLTISNDVELGKCTHNLPIPDFDETGFVGRRDEAEKVKNLVLGTYPVISLIGEGGVGKTSLALKVAYDLLDDLKNPFDAIVWVTSKTTRLGTSEIKLIENAISNSIGIFKQISSELGAAPSGAFAEIIEYLREFKILLVLDNLETVLDDNIREFLRELPQGSKVLITSRISVGALDYPYHMNPLDKDESVRLLRALASVRSLDLLLKAKQEMLLNYCAKLKYNPGFIKWFVSAVHAGSRPEALLADSKIFLEFCLKNVYEHLSEHSKSVLNVMMVLNSTHSFSMLHYLADMETKNLEKALLQLKQSNMINMQNNGAITLYKLSELPSLYLKNFHKPSPVVAEKLLKKHRQIIASTEDINQTTSKFPYNINNISFSDNSLRVVVKYLKDAMRKIKENDLPAAHELILRAKEIEPGYYETNRVEAILKTEMKDIIGARDCYELAIHSKPDSSQLRYWYGGFLLRYCDEHDLALEQFKKAKGMDASSCEIDLDMARAYLYKADFEECRRIIQSLKERNLNDRNKMILFSMELQFYKRKGEHLIEQREFSSGLNFFAQMFEFFDSAPESYKDAKNCVCLESTFPSYKVAISVISRGGLVPAEYKKLSERMDIVFSRRRVSEISKEQGIYYGVVHNLQSTYGFIEINDGSKRVFMHKSNLASDSDWGQLVAGQTRVRFNLGSNEQGMCAVNIVLDNNEDIYQVA
jgi:LuxR family glucitol operon transcriptional activator